MNVQAVGFVGLLVLIGGLLFVGLVVVVLILVVRKSSGGGRVLGGASLTQPGPFTIQGAAASGPGPVEIWINYAVMFPYERPLGAKTSQVFCLVVEIDADGQRMTFGHGGRHPQDGTLDFEGLVHYGMVWAPGNEGTPSRYSARVLIKKLSTCPRVLRGTISVGQGTQLASAQLTMQG